jgi:hypothetical protein
LNRLLPGAACNPGQWEENMMIGPILSLSAALALVSGAALAEVPNNTVKIGVLSDMSDPFSSQAGQGSVGRPRWRPRTSRRR